MARSETTRTDPIFMPEDPNKKPIANSRKSGLAARQGALRLLHAVLSEQSLLEDAYARELSEGPLRKLNGSDRAFAKRIVITVLQHLGEIDIILSSFLERGLPKKSGPLRNILRIGAAELIYLDVPPHAVVDSAVAQFSLWRKYSGFKGLTNAVLRKVSSQGKQKLADINPAKANLPDWLYASWVKSYGERATEAIIVQSQKGSIPLDLSLKDISENSVLEWQKRLEAKMTPNGSLRLFNHERVDLIEGYEQGAWWVQDAAAALPVKLFGNLEDIDVLDLCAAPGGKSLQLAANGASVTALDRSKARIKRLEENIKRLGFDISIIAQDVLAFSPERQWPAILLDAPCSATGTLRRHPEIIHQRKPGDISHFAKIQANMLDKAASLLTPGGTLIYCTCSLQPEEGPDRIDQFLAHNRNFEINPINQDEIKDCTTFLQRDGTIRTRPDFWADIGGLDGFFIARLRKNKTVI